ncbi:MAG: 3-deoxy-D-manno-octulosonic acid kinase [Gammaproteobacteria bacterium]|nr:3-deoxy-D-manno-octulosonic acid kinase [Gammaproteobacteria bacterium]
MQLIEARSTPVPDGCILYDAAYVRHGLSELFAIDEWAARGALEHIPGGRGSVAVIRHQGERWILRHYRRGGLAAKVATDRYLWMGAERTRSFAEWRLLAMLYARGLPVPRPVAARYLRRGMSYTADLITVMVEHTATLAQALRAGRVEADVWRQIGATIARFHAHGVYHADLNAHNVLLATHEAPSSVPRIYLIDFDRGRIRSRGGWERRVLERLHRSLEKVTAATGATLDDAQWRALLHGYEQAR